MVRRYVEDDLVDRLGEQSLLDRIHRIVPNGHGADDGGVSSQLELWQRRAKDALCLGRLVVAFRMQQVELGLGGVEHDQAEPYVPVLGTVADCLTQ